MNEIRISRRASLALALTAPFISIPKLAATEQRRVAQTATPLLSATLRA